MVMHYGNLIWPFSVNKSPGSCLCTYIYIWSVNCSSLLNQKQLVKWFKRKNNSMGFAPSSTWQGWLVLYAKLKISFFYCWLGRIICWALFCFGKTKIVFKFLHEPCALLNNFEEWQNFTRIVSHFDIFIQNENTNHDHSRSRMNICFFVFFRGR